ncbi:MAG: hypothetical protein DRJ32_05540 [Thermoprotei archaeon]|nr:MAG: hypothetical protein DRJ32_05540 [Thermoprotei archaeon]
MQHDRCQVEVDVSPLENMLKIINYLKKRERIKFSQLKELLNSRAYRYMLFTHFLSTSDIVKVFSYLQKGSQPREEKLKWLYNEFKNCIKNIDKYYKFAETLKSGKAEVIEQACNRVMGYLPGSAEIEAKVYVLIGGSDAYGVNLLDTSAIIMNSTHFLNNIDKFTAVLAHELHHKALWRSREVYWRLDRIGLPRIKYVYDIISEVIGEGVASIVAAPYVMFEKYNLIKDNIRREYEAVEEGIINIYENFSEEKAERIFSQLYSNIGPIYMVGIDMALKIEKHQGRESLIESLDDPTAYIFFEKYMEVAKEQENAYIYSEKLMQVIRKVRDTVTEIY